MPTYDYKCIECNNIQEQFLGIKEEKQILCNKCGSICERQFTPNASFVLKGSGWPTQEYRLKSQMLKKNSRMAGVSKEKDRYGESVRNISDLKKVKGA